MGTPERRVSGYKRLRRVRGVDESDDLDHFDPSTPVEHSAVSFSERQQLRVLQGGGQGALEAEEKIMEEKGK